MKEIALLKAIWHCIWCGLADVNIERSEKANEWIPVTKISCDKCGKVFYSRS